MNLKEFYLYCHKLLKCNCLGSYLGPKIFEKYHLKFKLFLYANKNCFVLFTKLDIRYKSDT